MEALVKRMHRESTEYQLNPCLGCGRANCRAIALSNAINEDIKLYFKDTTHLTRDVSKAVRFQRSQHNHLFKALRDKIKSLETKYKILEKENQLIKSENIKLKNSFRTNTESPFNLQSIENLGNNSSIVGRKPDLSRIFGIKNECQTNPNQSLFQSSIQSSNMSSLRATDNSSNLLSFQTPTHSKIRFANSSASNRYKELLNSSQFRQRRPLNSSFTPMSTCTESTVGRNPRFDDTMFTRTPSSFSTLSTMSFGVRPNKEKVVHKVTPFKF